MAIICPNLKQDDSREEFNTLLTRLGGKPLTAEDAGNRKAYAKDLSEPQRRAYALAHQIWSREGADPQAAHGYLDQMEHARTALNTGVGRSPTIDFKDLTQPSAPQRQYAVSAPLTGFYSAAQRSLEAAPMKKTTPQQWTATLEKDPSAKRELDALGFSTWLEEQPKGQPVTREQVQNWLNANKVEVVEQRFVEKEGDPIKAAQHRVWPPGENYQQTLLKIPNTDFKSKHFNENEFVFIMHSDRIGPNSEKLLMPEQIQSDIHQKGRKAGYADPEKLKERQQILSQMQEFASRALQSSQELENFIRSSFPRNILYSHVQDIVQYAAGLKDDTYINNEEKRIAEEAKKRGLLDKYLKAQKEYDNVKRDLQSRLNLVGKEYEKAPDIPFKGDLWWQLGLKWALKEAAQKGYDGLVLPTAKQVAQASGGKEEKLATLYNTKIPSWIKKYVNKLGGTIEQVPIDQFQDKKAPNIVFPTNIKEQDFYDYLSNYVENSNDDTSITGKALSFLDMIDQRLRQGADLKYWQRIVNDYLDTGPFRPLTNIITQGYTDKDGKHIKALGAFETTSNFVVHLTPQMREALTSGQPMFAVQPGEKRQQSSGLVGQFVNRFRKPVKLGETLKGSTLFTQVSTLLESGRTVEVAPETYQPLWDVVKALGPLIPKEVNVIALEKAVPSSKGNAQVFYKPQSDKAYSVVINMPIDDLVTTRAFVNTTKGGQSALFINRFNGSDMGQKRLIGELWHETVHALRRQNYLFGGNWQRLIDHMKTLDILNMDFIDIFKGIQSSSDYTDEDRGVSLKTLYHHLYKNAYQNDESGLRDAIEEEGVAHMIELAQHGVLDLTPVQDIIDLMKKGELQKNPNVVQTGGIFWAKSPYEKMKELTKATIKQLGYGQEEQQPIAKEAEQKIQIDPGEPQSTQPQQEQEGTHITEITNKDTMAAIKNSFAEQFPSIKDAEKIKIVALNKDFIGLQLKLPHMYAFADVKTKTVLPASQSYLKGLGLLQSTINKIIDSVKADLIRDANKPAEKEKEIELRPLSFEEYNQQPDIVNNKLGWTSDFASTVESVADLKINGKHQGYAVTFNGKHSTIYVQHEKGETEIFNPRNENGYPWASLLDKESIKKTLPEITDSQIEEIINKYKEKSETDLHPTYTHGNISIQGGWKEEMLNTAGISLTGNYSKTIDDAYKVIIKGKTRGYLISYKDGTKPDIFWPNKNFAPLNKVELLSFGSYYAETIGNLFDKILKGAKPSDITSTFLEPELAITPEGWNPPKYKNIEKAKKELSPLALKSLEAIISENTLKEYAPTTLNENQQFSKTILGYLADHGRTMSPSLVSQLEKVGKGLVPQPEEGSTTLTVPEYSPSKKPTPITPAAKFDTIGEAAKTLSTTTKSYLNEILNMHGDYSLAAEFANQKADLDKIGPEWNAKIKEAIKTYLDQGNLSTDSYPARELTRIRKDLKIAKKPFHEEINQLQDPTVHTYTFSGKAGGGTKPKEVWKDENGQEYMFKPVKAGEEFLAYGEAMGGQISRLLNPKAPAVYTIKLGNRFGSLQAYVPNEGTLREQNLKVQDLSTSQIQDLQREQIVDWLISNHDAHDNQFLVMDDGSLVGIDKGQAFKYLGNDKLAIDYHPNAKYGEKEPIYNTLWRKFKNDDLPNFLNELPEKQQLDKVQSELKDLTKEYENTRKELDNLKELNNLALEQWKETIERSINPILKGENGAKTYKKLIDPFISDLAKVAIFKDNLEPNEYYINEHYVYETYSNQPGYLYRTAKLSKFVEELDKELDKESSISIYNFNLKKAVPIEELNKAFEYLNIKEEYPQISHNLNDLIQSVSKEEGLSWDLVTSIKNILNEFINQGYDHLIIPDKNSLDGTSIYGLAHINFITKSPKQSINTIASPIIANYLPKNLEFADKIFNNVTAHLDKAFNDKKYRSAFKHQLEVQATSIKNIIHDQLRVIQNQIVDFQGYNRFKPVPQQNVDALIISNSVYLADLIQSGLMLESFSDIFARDKNAPTSTTLNDLSYKLNKKSNEVKSKKAELQPLTEKLQEKLYKPIIDAITRLQEVLDNNTYKQLILPYAQSRFGNRQLRVDAFVDYAVKRKNSLGEDFLNFYIKLGDIREAARPQMETYSGGGSIDAGERAKFKDIRENLPSFKDLTDAELRAIRDYTGSAYSLLNGNLRSRKAISDDKIDYDWFGSAGYAALIASGLEKLPSHVGTLYRRESNSWHLSQFKVGHVFTNKQFLSTTFIVCKPGESEVIYQIESLTGKAINQISHHQGEREVLFPPNKQFLVTKVYKFKGLYGGEHFEIHLQELPEMDFSKLD